MLQSFLPDGLHGSESVDDIIGIAATVVTDHGCRDSNDVVHRFRTMPSTVEERLKHARQPRHVHRAKVVPRSPLPVVDEIGYLSSHPERQPKLVFPARLNAWRGLSGELLSMVLTSGEGLEH